MEEAVKTHESQKKIHQKGHVVTTHFFVMSKMTTVFFGHPLHIYQIRNTYLTTELNTGSHVVVCCHHIMFDLLKELELERFPNKVDTIFSMK